MSAVALADIDPRADEGSTGGDGSIGLAPSDAFITSPAVREVTERALAYLAAGYAVHFCGPPGTGKTTLAFHVATQLGRPAVLIHGDHEFGSSDLIGRESGYHKSRVVDNYISSVFKFEEEGRALWMDNRITAACRLGHTIIYDEFNRSKPEANNPLLSVLSEGILNVPRLHGRGEGYVSVHPDFRAIFTSNPAEYAGVFHTQDALLDRMITLHLAHYDRETEIAITASKSGIDLRRAEKIVDVIRLCRSEEQDHNFPTLRAAIALARVLAANGGEPSYKNPAFVWACRDILAVPLPKRKNDGGVSSTLVEHLLRRMESGCKADDAVVKCPDLRQTN